MSLVVQEDIAGLDVPVNFSPQVEVLEAAERVRQDGGDLRLG